MKNLFLIIILFFSSIYINLQAQAPQEALNVTSTTTTNSFNLLTNAVVIVDPNIAINYTSNITGFSVVLSNGKQNGDVLSYTGTLPSGISATAYNSSTGVLSFTGTTSAANWQALLRTVTFRAYTNAGVNRSISFSAGILNSFNNGHFYEFVSASGGTWTNAKAGAAAKRYLNYTGYLATITSQAENDYIKQIANYDSWIGASSNFTQINAALGTNLYANQAESETKWYWVTGPEAGTQFMTSNTGTIAGKFSNWATGEPNSTGGEHFAGLFANQNAKWNDFPNTNTSLGGYIVEYGGLSNDIVQTPSYSLTMSVSGTPPGNALSFDGTNDYIYTSTLVTNPTLFTLEAWFNTSAAKSGGIVGFNKDQTNTLTGEYDRFIWMGSDGKINFGVYNGSNNVLTSAVAYNDGKYHHVAASFGNSTGMKLYIDGALIASNSLNSVNAYVGYWKIGGFRDWANNGAMDYFSGKIDEVRIWNTIRTQTDIQNNMFNVVAPSTSGLSYYYNFDQGNPSGTNSGNTTLFDQTSNVKNGTMSGFALSGTTSNWVESYAMVVPKPATTNAIVFNGFTANWSASTIGSFDNYILDVSTNSGFTSFVTGYNNKNVGTATSFAVTGLAPNTTYYWRVRADKTSVTGQGGYSTQTVVTLKEPINITSTTISNSFNLLTNAAIAVDPNLVINYSQNIDGFRVIITTNKQNGDILAYTGALPSGITPVAYNASTGVLAFTGTTSAANWQTLLRTVTFRAYKNSSVVRSISFSAGSLNSFSNGHFYELVTSSVTWANAKTAADAKSYLNYTGYLATVTSSAENDYIKQILSADAWMGATDDHSYINAVPGATYANQNASEGKWTWVTGPEAGTQFWNGNGSGSVLSGKYANWYTPSSEPNNAGTTEHYGQFYSTNNGTWNDLGTSTLGYLVEYGGLATDIVQTPSYSVTMNVSATEPGNALNFNGTNSYVNIPDSNSLDLTNNYTIEAWIKPESFTSLGGIVDKYQTNSANGYTLRLTGASPFNGIIFDEMSTANGILTTNKWYHIAAVNNNGTRIIYVNGVSVPLTGTATAVVANTDPLRIGCDFSTRFFDGNIDEVRIWNVVRSQTQIVANMNGTIAPTTANLVSYYNFNQGITDGTNTGLTTLYDQTTTLNNGTLTNFGLNGATSTNWLESYAMVVPKTTAATSKYSLGFTANWTASSIGTTEKYYLDVATNAAFTSLVSGYSNKDVGDVTSSVINTGLSANTTYYYRVRAEKATVTGTGAYSNVTSVTTNTTETLVATAASDRTSVSFKANWSAPAIHNISDYLLDVSTDSNFATFVSGYNGLSVTGLSQSVTGLTANTVYYYRVRVSGYNNSNTITTSTIAPFATIATSATSVCANGSQPTITFTGSGSVAPYTFTYTINSGSNQTVTTTSGNSVTVSVPTATSGLFTYSLVSVTDASSGTNSQTGSVGVTVNPIPVPTFSSAPAATICSSINTTYTTQSGQTNYSWSVPGTLNTDYTITSGGIGTSSSTVTLKWLTSGSKTVTVNYTSTAGCTNGSPASTITSVSITPTVATIIGTTTTTEGLSTTLSNTTVGGVWSSSNAAIASIDSSGVVTAVGQGTATITYTVTSGSCSDFVTTTYTVNAAPVPTITAVSPLNPVVGATVTITGTNFLGTSLVTVGTYQVTFTVVSATSITFVLPTGTGTNLAVAVTTPGGTATSTSPNLITYNTAGLPTITFFTPTSAGTGQTVVITGTNLTNPTTITFGGTNVASYTVNSDTQITVVIGSGTTGSVVVTTAHPTPATASTSFTYLTCGGNPTLYSGGAITICGSQNPLNITTDSNASNYSALSWITSGTGTFADNTTANALTSTTYSPSAADILAGSVRLTLTATATAGCIDAISYKDLNLKPITVAGSVSPMNASVCYGSTSGLLTLTGHSGSVVRWESSVSPFTTWTTIANTATTYTSGVLTETTKFRAVVNNNDCGEENATHATISITTSTYDGTSWINGTPDSSTTVFFTGNYTITSDLNACSIRVSNNAAVTVNSNNNVYLNGAITVDAGSSFTMNNNTNLLQSDASAVNTGNIVVKRNSSPIRRLDHTLWSSPVTGQNLFSFSPNTLVNRFYMYNTATNSYVTTGLSNTSLFTPAKGFAVRAPNNQSTTAAEWTGTFTGVPNNGTKYVALATNAVNGYHHNLVGNPYPSTISATDFYNVNSSKIGGTLYFYAHTLTLNANGLFPTGTNYATWTGLGGTAATLGTIIPNGTIQVGQGFIVKAIAAGDVAFTNTMRMSNQTNQFMRTNTTTPETHRMWLNLKSDTGVDINQILVGYMDGATQGVDTALDGLSFGNTGSYLYSKIENDNYVIQARSLPFDGSDEVPLGFNCESAGSYKITLTNTDGLFAGSQDVFVRDNLTGTDTSIKTTPYTFTSNAGVFDSRFKLVYTQALGVPSEIFTENSVIVYKNTDWFHVNTKGSEMKDIMVYDVSGRLIYTLKDINANTAVLKGLTTSNQVLLLKIYSQEDKIVTIKVIN